jgi:hypothetical protein
MKNIASRFAVVALGALVSVIVSCGGGEGPAAPSGGSDPTVANRDSYGSGRITATVDGQSIVFDQRSSLEFKLRVEVEAATPAPIHFFKFMFEKNEARTYLCNAEDDGMLLFVGPRGMFGANQYDPSTSCQITLTEVALEAGRFWRGTFRGTLRSVPDSGAPMTVTDGRFEFMRSR